MNRQQRMNNRETAQWLGKAICCDRCGMREGHYIVTREVTRLEEQMGIQRQGFYTCPDLYDEEGRRKDTSDGPGRDDAQFMALGTLAAMMTMTDRDFRRMAADASLVGALSGL